MASLEGLVYMLMGIFVIFGVILIIFIVTFMFTHRLRIRDPIKKDTYINDYWVWEKKDKETGIVYWKSIMGGHINTPKPPAAAINIGKKGKKYAEAYQLSSDEFVWITDKGITIITKDVDVIGKDGKPMMKDGKAVTKQEQQIVDIVHNVESGKTEYKYIDTFKPYTVVQRETMIAQHKKADDIKNNKWTADKIIAISSMGALFFLVAMGMIFWADIAKPALDAQNTALAQQQGNVELTNKIAMLMQSMGYELDDVEISQTAKKQNTGNVIKTGNEEPPMKEE